MDPRSFRTRGNRPEYPGVSRIGDHTGATGGDPIDRIPATDQSAVGLAGAGGQQIVEHPPG